MIGHNSHTNEELAAQAKAGDKAALAQLWEQNRPLLGMMFRKLMVNPASSGRAAACGITYEDLEQEGYFVIIKAVEQYSYEVGVKFVTFLKYPVMDIFFNAIGLRTARQKKEPLNSAASLDEPVNDDVGSLTRESFVPDASSALAFRDVEERLYLQGLHTALDECLDAIDAQQAAAIRAIYYARKSKTVFAQEQGITYDNARQLEVKGLRGLRRNARKLRAYREDIITRHAYGTVSFEAWKNGGSSPEQIVERLEAQGVL